MIKSKYKRILCFFAVFLILFLFLFSVTASAGAVTNTHLVSFNAPANINFHYSLYDPQAASSDLAYIYATYSYSPILVPNYYELGNRITYTHDVEEVHNSTPLKFYSYSVPTVVPSNNDNYGLYSFSVSGPEVSSSDYANRLTVTNFYISVTDFYIWNHDFNNSILSGVPIEGYECNISVHDNEEQNFYPKSIAVTYEVAGVDSNPNTILITSEDVADIESGLITLTPAMLGFEGDSVIYIKELRVLFDNIPTTLAGFDLGFEVNYYLYPFFDNYAASGSGGSDNPALALLPYTTWIGDAVSGFMDFELFKGFTLGGIFMTLLAFTCVVWFLKLVAGG